MSLFSQDCPQCGAEVSRSQHACACGYCFNPEQELSEQQIAARLEHEAQLQHEYWEARVIQAGAALEAAKEDLAVSPDDVHLAARALVAEQALNAARAEFKRHRFPRPNTSCVVVRPANRPTQPQSRATTVAAVHVITPPAPTVAPLPPVTPIIEAMPTPAFREVQAEKAERITRTLPAPVVATAPITPAAKPAPVHLTRAALTSAPSSTPSCPNCQAAIAANTTRCRCGFELRAAREMPSLSLDAGTLAILNLSL